MKNAGEQLALQLDTITNALHSVPMEYHKAETISTALKNLEDLIESLLDYVPNEDAAVEKRLDSVDSAKLYVDTPLKETDDSAPELPDETSEDGLFKQYNKDGFDYTIETLNLKKYMDSDKGYQFREAEFPFLTSMWCEYFKPTDEQLSFKYAHIIQRKNEKQYVDYAPTGWLFTNAPTATPDDYDKCDLSGGLPPIINGITTQPVYSSGQTNVRLGSVNSMFGKNYRLQQVNHPITVEESTKKFIHLLEIDKTYIGYLFDDLQEADTDLSKYKWVQRYKGRRSYDGKGVQYDTIKHLL